METACVVEDRATLQRSSVQFLTPPKPPLQHVPLALAQQAREAAEQMIIFDNSVIKTHSHE